MHGVRKEQKPTWIKQKNMMTNLQFSAGPFGLYIVDRIKKCMLCSEECNNNIDIFEHVTQT